MSVEQCDVGLGAGAEPDPHLALDLGTERRGTKHFAALEALALLSSPRH